MMVLRSTMERALTDERQRARAELVALASRYGDALDRVSALQEQMSAWVLNKAENITPEQAAQMFYEQDDRWQAAFFNCMQARVMAAHNALPAKTPGEFRFSPGVPAGERQWCEMACHLTDKGFETIEAMYQHAKLWRDPAESAA